MTASTAVLAKSPVPWETGAFVKLFGRFRSRVVFMDGASKSRAAERNFSSQSFGSCSIAPPTPESARVVPRVRARAALPTAVPSGARSMAFRAVVLTSTLNTQSRTSLEKADAEESGEGDAEARVRVSRPVWGCDRRPPQRGRWHAAAASHDDIGAR